MVILLWLVKLHLYCTIKSFLSQSQFIQFLQPSLSNQFHLLNSIYGLGGLYQSCSPMSKLSNDINFRSFGPVLSELWLKYWLQFIKSKILGFKLPIRIRSLNWLFYGQNFGKLSTWKLVQFRSSFTSNWPHTNWGHTRSVIA